jgi:hypothetical protein
MSEQKYFNFFEATETNREVKEKPIEEVIKREIEDSEIYLERMIMNLYRLMYCSEKEDTEKEKKYWNYLVEKNQNIARNITGWNDNKKPDVLNGISINRIQKEAFGYFRQERYLNETVQLELKSIPQELPWKLEELLTLSTESLLAKLPPMDTNKRNVYIIEKVEQMVEQHGTLENTNMYIGYEYLLEMGNYYPNDSGLPYRIWFDPIGKDRNIEHNLPRLKVFVKDNIDIPVSIEETPRILLKNNRLTQIEKYIDYGKMKIIYSFITKHQQILLRHWNREINDDQLIDYLMKHK